MRKVKLSKNPDPQVSSSAAERRPYKAKVAGSNPASPTKRKVRVTMTVEDAELLARSINFYKTSLSSVERPFHSRLTVLAKVLAKAAEDARSLAEVEDVVD